VDQRKKLQATWFTHSLPTNSSKACHIQYMSFIYAWLCISAEIFVQGNCSCFLFLNNSGNIVKHIYRMHAHHLEVIGNMIDYAHSFALAHEKLPKLCAYAIWSYNVRCPVWQAVCWFGGCIIIFCGKCNVGVELWVEGTRSGWFTCYWNVNLHSSWFCQYS